MKKTSTTNANAERPAADPLDKTITVEERRFVITTGRHLENWRSNPTSPLAGQHCIEYVPVELATGETAQEPSRDTPTGATGEQTENKTEGEQTNA